MTDNMTFEKFADENLLYLTLEYEDYKNEMKAKKDEIILSFKAFCKQIYDIEKKI